MAVFREGFGFQDELNIALVGLMTVRIRARIRPRLISGTSCTLLMPSWATLSSSRTADAIAAARERSATAIYDSGLWFDMDKTDPSANANQFENLRFADFERMAQDPTLSSHEKIGFPDAYREGYEAAIYADIESKLPKLAQTGLNVLDIGPGCAALPRMLIKDCERRRHSLVLVDSAAMLATLPDAPSVTKVAGFYPDCRDALSHWVGRFDVILCYSVFHYIFVEASFWRFLDCSLELLAPGGQMLIGDIPNISKRKRFFSAAAGVRFHQQFMQTTDAPIVDFNVVEPEKIDDAVILGAVMRARAQGCDAYWMPQPAALPMANRREDILICKP